MVVTTDFLAKKQDNSIVGSIIVIEPYSKTDFKSNSGGFLSFVG